MPFTRVVFEINDCDNIDEALDIIRGGTVEPVEHEVDEDDG
jgi:hypothetical protein